MFVNLMRSNQRWLMIIVSALVIISFVFFYSNRTNLDRGVSDQVGKIYGRTLTTEELARIERQLDVVKDGLYELYMLVTDNGMDEGNAPINHLILQHEAAAYGIEPSADEIKDAEMKLPVFQTAGSFDPTLYAKFVDDKLTPRGSATRNWTTSSAATCNSSVCARSWKRAWWSARRTCGWPTNSVLQDERQRHPVEDGGLHGGRARTLGGRDQEILRRAKGPSRAARAPQGAVREIRAR